MKHAPMLVLAFAGLAAILLPSSAWSATYEEQQRLWPELQHKAETLKREIRCAQLVGSLDSPDLPGCWNEKERRQSIRDGKIKRLSWEQFRHDMLERGLDPKFAKGKNSFLYSQYRTCTHGPAGTGEKDYYCDLLVEQQDVHHRIIVLMADPWVGTAKCHIRRDYIEDKRADGCSAPLTDPASKHFKSVLKVDCDEHDLCYSTPGSSKSDCDREFHRGMLATCRGGHNRGLYRPLCKATADAWALSVRLGGIKGYLDDQKWARDHCGDG